MKHIFTFIIIFLLSISFGFSQIISEDFDSGMPGTWTIIDNVGADTWYGEINYLGSDLDGTPFAFVNSDAAGSVDMDEELITPTFDATSYSSVSLEFDHHFYYYNVEIGDVDVWDGSSWNNVYSVSGSDVGDWGAPDHQTIDISAYINASMKVRFHYYNANYDLYWAVDNVVITGVSSAPMAYSSCTTTQNNTDNVSANSTNNEVIGVEVVTTGSTSPLDATSFTFNTTGTNDVVNDIANATLWYTGTSGTFATTTQVGSVVSNPNGTFTINGTQTLSSGTNHFWLSYDVQASATLGNIIDAQCTSVTVDGTSHTPSTTNPSGNRLIDYCTNTNTTNTSYYIDDFSTTGGTTNITNNSSGFSANGYGDFTSMTVTQEQGLSVDFSIAESGGSMKFGIWVDWNQDGDFSDAGENVYINNNYNTSVTGSFMVPTSATTGDTRMRVVGKEIGVDDVDACTGTDHTEAEDYTFHVNVGTPMSFFSSTTTQNNTSDTYKGLSNVELIGIEINTTGHITPINVSSFTFNTNGSTAPSTDITNAKLWTTGTSSTFATTTQIGNVISGPNGTFTISSGSNLPYTLENGTNYFWITYDVPTTATTNNYVDAECTSVTVDGTTHTPSTTAPSGNRKIIAPPTFDGTFESANNFSGNGMSRVSDAQNYWKVGTATDNGGIHSAFITTSGSGNNYDNTATSVSHFYFDYVFPAGESVITLTFDWKCDGEGSYDNLQVFLEPTSETPAAGAANNSSYRIGSSYYSENTNWQTVNITIDAANAGTLKRIVFQWENDGSYGDNPPAAIDNIVIDTHIPAAPNCAENLLPTDGTTDVCNATATLTWDAPSTGDAPTSYYLYFGTDNPPTTIENGTDIGDVNSYDLGTLNENTIYYWQIIPYNSGGTATSCSVYSFTTGNGQANDLPCNAESIDIGSTASGNNDCSSDNSESGAPSCWTSGALNTVWYSFVAPASGAVDIATSLGSINSTQVAVYSGVCSSLTLVDCNQDAPTCDADYDNSEFTVTGLTSGSTYFVRVDGEDDDVGTFNITISDNSVGLPIVFGQDCGIDNAIPVCNAQFTVGDPGFQAIGNYCDFDGSQDCTSGERGAVWYHIEIGADGVLDFTLVPNDYDGTDETDYDFLLYRVSSPSTDSSVVDCSCINDNTCGPIRCDYSGLGITGMYSSSDDQAPPAYSPDYDYAFVKELNVLAGDEFFLVIQNFSNSTSGFDIDFGSTPITIPGGVPTSLTWTGGANNTDWYEPLNWGDCAYYPNENIDANIIASSAYQPVIDATDPNDGTNARVKNLTISSGANLTLSSGQTLELYGDYNNTGIFNANSSSTVMCKSDLEQELDGSLQGTSAFGHLKIAKTDSSVIAMQGIEVKGDFITSDLNSVFDLNSKAITLGGDFNNFAGSSTFLNTASSSFSFNGSGTQMYSSGGYLELNNVGIGQSIGSTVNLLDNLIINSSGGIDFGNGIVQTGAASIVVMNTSNSAINVGNSGSYINGNLVAYIANNTDLYNFPVGDADQYALARLQNHNLNGVSNLSVKFYDTFTSTGSLDPSRAIDFGTPYISLSTGGMWEIEPNSQPSSGAYDIFLTFDDGQGYDGGGLPIGNAFPDLTDNQFGVLKRNSSSDLAADWYGESIGTINANGGVGRMLSDGYASRYGISSFSDFSLGKVNYPLPIELLSFSAKCKKGNALLDWKVASEINSNYYSIEKSTDARKYEEIGTIITTEGLSFPKKYEFVDEAYSQAAYYRLNEFDYDGKKSSFKPIYLDCTEQLDYSIKSRQISYRNILVDLNIPKGVYQLTIYDNTGKIIHTQSINMPSELEQLNIRNVLFTDGIYLILVQNQYHKYSSKIIMN